MVNVKFPEMEAVGKTSREVGEAVVGQVEAFQAGLQPVQGVGQVVQAVGSEGKEVEGGERGETGWKQIQLVVAEIKAVQRWPGERGWQAGQVVPECRFKTRMYFGRFLKYLDRSRQVSGERRPKSEGRLVKLFLVPNICTSIHVPSLRVDTIYQSAIKHRDPTLRGRGG